MDAVCDGRWMGFRDSVRLLDDELPTSEEARGKRSRTGKVAVDVEDEGASSEI